MRNTQRFNARRREVFNTPQAMNGAGSLPGQGPWRLRDALACALRDELFSAICAFVARWAAALILS